MTWLRSEVDSQDKSLVSTLWCSVCRQYEKRICGHKNFSRAWIDGSSNHKTSNIADHADSEPHKAAMMYLRKDQAKARNEPITSYSPIARSSLSSSMDPAVRERVKKKFLGIENLLERESVLSVSELPIFVGCGTDGATVNVSDQNGMRGKLQAALPWLYWAWCYAHRLELACKDACVLKPTLP